MATIRRRGERWQVVLRRRGMPPQYKSFIKKSQAEVWARQQEVARDAGAVIDSRAADTLHVIDMLTRWRGEIVPTKAESSRESMIIRADRLIADLGRYTLTTLTPDIIQAWAVGRLRTIKPASLKKELHILTDAIECARVLWGCPAPANAAQDAVKRLTRLRLLRVKTEEPPRITDEIKSQIMNYVHRKPTKIKRLFAFAFETGMRRGELVKMRCEHVDWEKSILWVPETKTDLVKSIPGRWVPLSPAALEILRDTQLNDGYFWNVTPYTVTKAFRRIRQALGLPNNLKFHTTRHERTSRLFESGYDIPTVAAITDHRDWRSLQRYTHMTAEAVAKRLARDAHQDSEQRPENPPDAPSRPQT